MVGRARPTRSGWPAADDDGCSAATRSGRTRPAPAAWHGVLHGRRGVPGAAIGRATAVVGAVPGGFAHPELGYRRPADPAQPAGPHRPRPGTVLMASRQPQRWVVRLRQDRGREHGRSISHHPADRRAGRVGLRGAGRRAAVRAGRHRRGRAPGPGPAGRAGRGRHRDDAAGDRRHLAGVRHHRPGGPLLRRRPPGGGGERGRPGVLAGAAARAGGGAASASWWPARWSGWWPAAPARSPTMPTQWLRIAILGPARHPAGAGRQRLAARRPGHPDAGADRGGGQRRCRRSPRRCWCTRPGWGWPVRRSPTSARSGSRPALCVRALRAERVPQRPAVAGDARPSWWSAGTW